MGSLDLKTSIFLLITVLASTSVAQVSTKALKGRPATMVDLATLKVSESPKPSSFVQIISLSKDEVDSKKPFSKEKQEKTLKEFMGGLNGGGGDEVGLEFEASLRYALSVIVKMEPELYQKMKDRRLDEFLSTLRYVTINEPIRVKFKNVTQDSTAAYDPQLRVIVIDRNRWSKIPNARIQQALALHELAGILGFEETGMYSHSSLYKNIGTNTICNSIERDDSLESHIDIVRGGERKQTGMRITLLKVNMSEKYMQQQVDLVFERTYDNGSTDVVSAPPRDAFGDYVSGQKNTFKFVYIGDTHLAVEGYVSPTIAESAHHIGSGYFDEEALDQFSTLDFRTHNSKVYLTVYITTVPKFFGKFRTYICETVNVLN